MGIAFWLWCLALLYMTAPLEIILTGSDPDQGVTTPLPYYNYSRLLVGILAVYFSTRKVTRRRALAILAVLWPYLAFYVFEICYSAIFGERGSLLFSIAAIFGGIATAFGAAVSLGTRRYAKSTIYMLGFAIVLSVITVVLLPKVGVHSGLDKTGGAGRAGEWRGAYLHKNFLGHLSGITFGMTVCFGRRYFKETMILPIAIAALSMLCVVMSHSSSAIVLCGAIPMVYYLLVAPQGWKRAATSYGLVLFLVVFIPLRDTIISTGLALVGKHEDLSGRSSIWRVAQQLFGENPLFGGGLSYTFSLDFRARMLGMFGVNNVHNAFLDSLINFGVIGCLLLLAALGVILFRSWTLPLSADDRLTRSFFLTLFGAWAISGMSEVMAMRVYGVITQIGVIAIVGLCGVVASAERSPMPVGRTIVAKKRAGIGPAVSASRPY